MGYPSNCLGGHDIANNRGTISFCTACYQEMKVRTEAQEAVIRAAVAWRDTEPGSDAEFGSGNELHAAVDALLAAEPEWGKGWMPGPPPLKEDQDR